MTDTNPTIETLCALIETALPGAERGFKWNGPTYAVQGRDIITIGATPKGRIRLVLHRGAKAVDTKTGTRLIDDPSGRLKWATDQRAHTEFADEADIQASAGWITDICLRWAAAAETA